LVSRNGCHRNSGKAVKQNLETLGLDLLLNGHGMNTEPTSNFTRIDFPEKLLHIVDVVVAHAVDNTPLPDNLNDLTEWFETDGWDHLCSTTDDYFCALKLFQLAWYNFSDQELEANQEETVPITDEVRLAYARNLVAEAIEEVDEYNCPTVHSIQISNANGHVAILGWLVESHGQGGVVPVFQGIFSNKSDFYQSLRDLDFVLQTEEDLLKDETILRLWNQPPKPIRNVVVSVSWGNDLYPYPMSERTWNRVKAGKALTRVEPFLYEGKRYKANWCFNYSGFGSLLVTYDDAVGFDGKLSDALIVVDDLNVIWAS